MPAQSKFTPDVFLDAAARILAADGPDGLTLSAVLRATGASSGSLYYRFPDRPALLGALWQRTVTDYHNATAPALDAITDATTDDTPGAGAASAVAASLAFARDMVRWCREHPEAAAVLLAGRRALGDDQWAAALRTAMDAENSRRDDQTRRIVKGVRAEAGLPLETVLLAVVDLPYAAVRRYIAGRRAMPRDLERTVTQAMEAILQRPSQTRVPPQQM